VRLAALALVLLCALEAQAGVSSGPNPTAGIPAARTNTDFVIDAIPDTQNQANPGSIPGGDGVTPSEDDCSTATECVGEWCVHAKDCAVSWNAEGAKVLDAQLAVIRGEDKKDPKRAAVVLHLGDLADQHDVDVTDTRADACGAPDINAAHVAEWVTLEAHLLAPLRASGIPSLLGQGNHDASGCYEQKVVTPWSALPFFYGSTTDAVHADTTTIWAIKAPTRLGSICALTAGYLFYAETRDAAKTLSGCGGSFPTIIVKHNLVTPSLASGEVLAWNQAGGGDDLVDRAGHSYIWLAMGGHFTTPPLSAKGSAGGADSGATIFFLFSDFQEMKHRNYNEATPYGVTPANGGDGILTRIHVSPSRRFLHAYEWDPLRHRKGGYSNQFATSELYSTFDWCARFGGC